MTEEIDISKCICIYLIVKYKSMTEEIDISKCICIYTKYRFNLKNFKKHGTWIWTENTVPKLLDQAELLMISLNSKTANLN
jgi:hypothetical protein